MRALSKAALQREALRVAELHVPWLLATIYRHYGEKWIDKLDITVLIENTDDEEERTAISGALDSYGQRKFYQRCCNTWHAYDEVNYRMSTVYFETAEQYNVQRMDKPITPLTTIRPKVTQPAPAPLPPAAPDLDALIDRILRRQEARTLRSLTMSRALQALIVRLDAALDADEPTLRATVREVLDDLGHAVTWGDERGAA